MKKLILLRHGQSTYNLAHRFTGWADAPLTAQGHAQATQAGELLKEAGLLPQAAYSSCLLRARQTAQAVLACMPNKIPLQTDWRLNERHYGDLQDKTRQEAAQKYGLTAVLSWRQTFFCAPPPADDNSAAKKLVPAGVVPPNGESLHQTQQRAAGFLDQVLFPAYKYYDIQLLAAHEDLLRALAVYFKKLPPQAVEELVVPPATPWVMELDDTCHAVKDYFLGNQQEIAAFLKRRPE
ncbi:2,3-bisphosphoglycerate-dependent phosphoglycerate mutase [Candidatus Avelusimicrobium sp.]|uniref:2,3-bisphosphoglycerate-dependent phosphoglycerate mutase n=1 Tax=Candidatus Avelusimicrobium sp. TaxID=3048833 RepID=UPI003D7E5531